MYVYIMYITTAAVMRCVCVCVFTALTVNIYIYLITNCSESD